MKTPIQELIEEMEANSVAGEMFCIKQPNEFYEKYIEKEKKYTTEIYYHGSRAIGKPLSVILDENYPQKK
jgi:hypothetical protein